MKISQNILRTCDFVLVKRLGGSRSLDPSHPLPVSGSYRERDHQVIDLITRWFEEKRYFSWRIELRWPVLVVRIEQSDELIMSCWPDVAVECILRPIDLDFDATAADQDVIQLVSRTKFHSKIGMESATRFFRVKTHFSK